MTASAHRPQRFERVHVFRGLASLIVLLFHGTLIGAGYFGHEMFGGFFRFGFFGVHFFFVLSGFIIGYHHLGEFGRREKLKAYVVKRLVRVYPIYWIVLLMIVPLYFLFPAFGSGGETQPLRLVSSFLLFPQREWPVLGVAWTLRHEIWFYLVFGLAMFLKRPYGSWLLVAWGGASFAAYLTMVAGGVGVRFPLSFFLSAFNLEFLSGVVIAILVKKNAVPKSTAGVLVASGILLLAVSFFVKGPETGYGTGDTAFVSLWVAAFLLMAGAAWADRSGVREPPSSFRLLGDASYSLYLIHYPALSLFSKVLGALPVSGDAFAMMAPYIATSGALTAGVLLHLYCEKPLLASLRSRWLKGAT